MIKAERIRIAFMILYFLEVMMISYAAMESVYVANNFTPIILINSLILFLTSGYLLDYKALKRMWRNFITAARIREKYRKEVAEAAKTIKHKYGGYVPK